MEDDDEEEEEGVDSDTDSDFGGRGSATFHVNRTYVSSLYLLECLIQFRSLQSCY